MACAESVGFSSRLERVTNFAAKSQSRYLVTFIVPEHTPAIEQEMAMKNLMKAIRNVLRAMRRASGNMVRVTREIGGRLVSMLMPGVPVCEPDEHEVSDEAVPNQPDYFREMTLRAAAAQLMSGGVPSPEIMADLGVEERRWLAVMDDDMLKRIVLSKLPDLREHLRNRQTIRGVLRYEKAAVDAYLDALAGKQVEGEYLEPEHGSQWAMA